MAPGPRGTTPFALVHRRASCPQIPRWLPHLREKRLVVQRASAWFELDRARPGGLHARRKIWRPPKRALPPRHIDRSIARGSYRADRALPQAEELQGQDSLFSSARSGRLDQPEALVVLRHGRHQAFRKILSHAVKRRILLFKKAFHVG